MHDTKKPPQGRLFVDVNRVGSVDGQLLFKVFQVLPEMLVCLAEVVHCATGMQDRGVVLATAVQPNVRKRRLRHFLGEVHGDLARLDNLPLSRFALEQFDGQVEVCLLYTSPSPRDDR